MNSAKIFILLCFVTALNRLSVQAQTNTFRYSLVQSFRKNDQMPKLFPFGLDMGFATQMANSPFHIGFSTLYQNYGIDSFDDIKTSHNIYRFGLDLSLDVIKIGGITSFVRGSIGANRMVTRSYTGANELGHIFGAILAILIESDDDNDDEINIEPLDVLMKFSQFSPDYGGTFGVKWSFDQFTSFFAESGFRHLGFLKFIEKGNAIITPDMITYRYTEAYMSLLDFKVGLVHRF